MRAALLALALSAPHLFPSNAPAATPAAACDAACDKEAAACVDKCESAHPNDPAARVGCKVKCADTRKTCSKGCKLAPGTGRRGRLGGAIRGGARGESLAALSCLL